MRRASRPGADEAAWDPARGVLQPAAIEGADALVHLAGESVAAGRWTAARKARIRASRVDSTRLLAETAAGLGRRPRVLVCASATGFYGDRGDERLTEQSAPGRGFLAEVCREWEAAAEAARQAGIRTVHLRIGMVLSRAGGALAALLVPFRLGLGGVIGSGRQWMSWIALDDMVGVITHVLADERLAGPVNAVTPAPVTNAEFTRTLGRVLGRPTLVPLPALAARLLLGEMADEVLLASARVEPARLLASGFGFAHPTLEGALRHILGR